MVGHSMGGRIVVDLAAAEPDRALGVIPVNAAIGGGFDRFTYLGRFVPGLMPIGIGLLGADIAMTRSEEHTSELQSLMRISYAVFCLKKKTITTTYNHTYKHI